MTDYTDPYSGRPQFTLRLRITGTAGAIEWTLDALGGPASSFVSDPFPYQVKIGSYTRNGERNLDFRGNSTYHIADGGPLNLSGTLAVSFKHGPAPIVFGTASRSGLTYVASTVPGAPANPARVTGLTATSVALNISGPVSNGGSAIITYLHQIYDAATNAVVASWESPASNTGASGLPPGTNLKHQFRARNALGYGGWSPLVYFTTLPAVAPGISVTPSLSGTQASVTLTPPGGVSGVTSYIVQYRLAGTTPETTEATPTPSLLVSGLTPGATYEWRASALIGSYQTPWSTWAPTSQPNPATDPGDYFDGSTAAKADTTYAWLSTVNNSMSQALALEVTGWTTFAEGAGDSGGTGRVMRGTGGRTGQYAARVVFLTDTTAAGFQVGTAAEVGQASDVQDGTTCLGSIYVAIPARAQRMAAALIWLDGSFAELSTDVGDATIVSSGGWVRLVVEGEAPAGAEYAVVRAVDVTGDGWSLWQSGDVFLADDAMITVGQLFPYYDGSFPDDANYTYAWLATANASPSRRDVRPSVSIDPLADPDCDPLPQPPRPPVVLDECIEEVLIWRRYWAQIPAAEVSDWLTEVPTLAISTGSGGDPAQPKGARQVRIRVYPNPFGWPLEQIDPESYCSEQIISYIPPYSTLTLDGPLQRVFVSVSGGAELAGDHLLYGTGGIPATWPELSCGIQHVVSFDVPLDAPEGNIQTEVWLTRRA